VTTTQRPNAAIPNEINTDRTVSVVRSPCALWFSIVAIDVRNYRISKSFLRGPAQWIDLGRLLSGSPTPSELTDRLPTAIGPSARAVNRQLPVSLIGILAH
jgi:hypothetical protein